MKVTTTKIPEVLILEPQIFRDERGFIFESFNAKSFHNNTGLNINFVQDNHSCSRQNVLRGLHYQIKQPQVKLVRVVSGVIFDVAVDIRQSSPTFREWVGVILSEENNKQLLIPEGFAHGFLVLSESADVLYKTNNFYQGEYDRAIHWDDPDIDINWELKTPPILSKKDQNALLLKEAEIFV